MSKKQDEDFVKKLEKRISDKMMMKNKSDIFGILEVQINIKNQLKNGYLNITVFVFYTRRSYQKKLFSTTEHIKNLLLNALNKEERLAWDEKVMSVVAT